MKTAKNIQRVCHWRGNKQSFNLFPIGIQKLTQDVRFIKKR